MYRNAVAASMHPKPLGDPFLLKQLHTEHYVRWSGEDEESHNPQHENLSVGSRGLREHRSAGHQTLVQYQFSNNNNRRKDKLSTDPPACTWLVVSTSKDTESVLLGAFDSFPPTHLAGF